MKSNIRVRQSYPNVCVCGGGVFPMSNRGRHGNTSEEMISTKMYTRGWAKVGLQL